jgi:hypothetical protein
MINDFSQTVWSGVVTSVTREYRSDTGFTASVRCGGPEAILSRRAVGSFSTDARTTGDAAKTVFLLYLSNASDEGFLYNPALFTTGAAIQGYSAYGKSLARVFDELGAADGSRWWILPDGTFFFMSGIPVTQSSFCVDFTETQSGRLTDITSFETVTSADGYRNVQFVAGNGVTGEATNSAEISRMSRFGGTGRYENAVSVPLVSTVAEANAAAANILRSYEENSFRAVFTTNTDGIELFDRISINAPQFGLYGLTPFTVTEIAATDRPTGEKKLAFTYSVTAKMSDAAEQYVRPAEYWTESLSRISR